MTKETFTSCGGITASAERVLHPASNEEADKPQGAFLPTGNCRSYGNTCLPAGGSDIATNAMNGLLAFERQTGFLRAEAGVLLAQILDAIMGEGWFLPVTPGTRYVTMGGALTNDVHGKNDHGTGTFGCHVRRFELLRSNGVRMVCSPTANPGLFAATIGGMGLTGVVTWIEIQLMRAASPHVMQISHRFANLDDYFDRLADADDAHEYGVSWIDSLANGSALGRGVLMLGDHAGPDIGPKLANGSAMARPALRISPTSSPKMKKAYAATIT